MKKALIGLFLLINIFSVANASINFDKAFDNKSVDSKEILKALKLAMESSTLQGCEGLLRESTVNIFLNSVIFAAAAESTWGPLTLYVQEDDRSIVVKRNEGADFEEVWAAEFKLASDLKSILEIEVYKETKRSVTVNTGSIINPQIESSTEIVKHIHTTCDVVN